MKLHFRHCGGFHSTLSELKVNIFVWKYFCFSVRSFWLVIKKSLKWRTAKKTNFAEKETILQSVYHKFFSYSCKNPSQYSTLHWNIDTMIIPGVVVLCVFCFYESRIYNVQYLKNIFLCNTFTNTYYYMFYIYHFINTTF